MWTRTTKSTQPSSPSGPSPSASYTRMAGGPLPVIEAVHADAALVPVTVTLTTFPSAGIARRRQPMSPAASVSVRRSEMSCVFPFWTDVGVAVSDQPEAVGAAARRAGVRTSTDRATMNANALVGNGVRGSGRTPLSARASSPESQSIGPERSRIAGRMLKLGRARDDGLMGPRVTCRQRATPVVETRFDGRWTSVQYSAGRKSHPLRGSRADRCGSER